MMLIYILSIVLVTVITALFFFGINGYVRYNDGAADIETLNFIFGLCPGILFGLFTESSLTVTIVTALAGYLVAKFLVNEISRLIIKIKYPEAKFNIYSLEMIRLGRPRWGYLKWE